MAQHRSANLITRNSPLTNHWMRFSWTVGNLHARDVRFTEHAADGRIVGTEILRRDIARDRWSKLIAKGWKLQLTDDR